MTVDYYNSVWDALKDTPEAALNMRLRAELMRKIADRVNEWGLIQQEAADCLGITQPRFSDLLNGRINKFSLDASVNLTDPARLHLELAIEADKEVAA